MSSYGRQWERIYAVREEIKKLAPTVRTDSLTIAKQDLLKHLQEYRERLALLLARWESLESRAPGDELTRDDLNAAVTDAIFHAENTLRETIKAWEHVAQLEKRLAEEMGGVREHLQQLLAAQGYGMASIRVDMLKAILGKK